MIGKGNRTEGSGVEEECRANSEQFAFHLYRKNRTKGFSVGVHWEQNFAIFPGS